MSQGTTSGPEGQKWKQTFKTKVVVFVSVLFMVVEYKIYANSITEYVDILPFVLYYNSIEFDNTFISNLEV